MVGDLLAVACDIRDAADAIGKVVTPLDVPRNTPIVEA
jgi:hypothetical protein